MKMRISVFVGTSLDGFIARVNGDLDFLPPGGGEPHGYDEFMATVDALVIGRKTFETILDVRHLALWGQARFRAQHARPGPCPARGGGGANVRRSGRDRVAARRSRHRARVCRWRDHHPTVPPGRARSTPRHHARSRAHRNRNPPLRCHRARHRAQTRPDEAVRERPRPE